MVQIVGEKEPDGISFTTNTSGDTWCYLIYKGNRFEGHTKCLPEDEDFWSEKTGCFIAECKATIKKLKFVRAELVAALTPLVNFKKTLECCKDYNPNSFEAKRLRKEIYLKQKQIDEINAAIQDEQSYLTSYIREKDKFYKKQRAKRGQDK